MNEQTPGMEILEAMRLGVEYRCEIQIRGQKFRLRPLSNSEILEVTDEVLEIMNTLKPHQRHPQRENQLVARCTLVKASKPYPNSKELGGISDYLLGLMTAEELQNLYNEYVRICEKVNPKLESMPKEELDFLVESLKKSSNLESQMTDLPIWHLVNVCRRMIHDARQMDSTSGG